MIAPYRAQVNAIKQALRVRAAERNHPLTREPVIDTVERIQGQERDVVIASFTNSDPEYLLKDASFFYSPNRLNVLLSRARMIRIIVASPLACLYGAVHLLSASLPHAASCGLPCSP